jgi:hypothetical protein
VLVADVQKVKGLAALACKTDKIDSRVLAELSFRNLVPAIWLPTFELRSEREISRWRLHLVKHRSTLKNRVHSTLITFGHQRHMSDLFGVAGRRLLTELDIPEPWRSHVDASLVLIDDLEAHHSHRQRAAPLGRRSPLHPDPHDCSVGPARGVQLRGLRRDGSRPVSEPVRHRGDHVLAGTIGRIGRCDMEGVTWRAPMG